MLLQMPGYYSPPAVTREQVIAALFGAGEAGALYEPSDPATVFQERTGASAITPAGADDPVGTRLDVSGNDAHSTAPDDSKRPLLYVSGDLVGTVSDDVDDVLITPVIIGDACTLAWAGQLLDSTGIVFCQALSDRADASFQVGVAGTGPSGLRVSVRGGDLPADVGLSCAYTLMSAPAIMIAEWDGTDLSVEINGDANQASGTTLGSGGAGSATHNNALSSVPLAVRVFAEARRSGALTSTQRALLRRWLAQKAGVTL